MLRGAGENRQKLADTPDGKPSNRPWLRIFGIGSVMGVILLVGALMGLDHWIRTAPVPELSPEVSTTVLDRHGKLLRAYQVADGRWRLPVTEAEVDRGYVAQLLAYEDRRFYRHAGIDPLALLRAAWQAIIHGRPVSGASTITMQVARLLSEHPTDRIGTKLAQIRLALALERQLEKAEILQLYLTLAPFGSNIEGVRAASLSWFGKEPRRLTPAESALLVALPQSPEARRPDRHREAARAARDRVLARAARHQVLARDEAEAARAEPVPTARRDFPALAPHLADRIVTTRKQATTHQVTIDAGLQKSLETLLADRAARLPKGVSAALIVADHRTGEIIAHLGSAGFTDGTRSGWIDMTTAIRSPGSALKPLIYGLAFELGLAHPETLIEDRPVRFGNWTPANFGDGYFGTVSLREALQFSLNVPAVALLDAVGPAQMMARMRRAGAPGVLPKGAVPGLAIGLGGIGMSLRDLVQLYAAIARGGEAVTLRTDPEGVAETGGRVLQPGAAWQVADILAGAPAPVAAPNRQLAFKTGT
ncbi:MAG TPA: penicillin-binding protein 1C, partial [Paracoccaceae bacterium]|nr:penicillin-binding protein 1C [Paracoccaceae bacterium]